MAMRSSRRRRRRKKTFRACCGQPPNIAHRDIGAKLAFGRGIILSPGLLDHTHLDYSIIPCFRRRWKRRACKVVDHYNVMRPAATNISRRPTPRLAAGTPLNGLLVEVARQSNPR